MTDSVLLPSPSPVRGETFQSVLARLHLHAVLPALEELCEVSPEARALAVPWELSLRLALAGGPAATIVAEGGRVRVHCDCSRPAEITLHFFGAEQLNRMFLNQRALPPLPVGIPWKLPRLKTFIALTKVLEKYLKPPASALSDDAFRRAHLRLLLRVLIGAVRTVGLLDSHARATLEDTPSGTAEIHAPALETVAWIAWNRRAGRLDSGPGRLPGGGRADVAITFRDEQVAAAALASKLDGAAAVGLGQVSVRGLVPLADGLSLVMDRVEAYLQP